MANYDDEIADVKAGLSTAWKWFLGLSVPVAAAIGFLAGAIIF